MKIAYILFNQISMFWAIEIVFIIKVHQIAQNQKKDISHLTPIHKNSLKISST